MPPNLEHAARHALGAASPKAYTVPMPNNRKRFRRFDVPGHAHMLTWSCYRRQPFFKSDRACQWLADGLTRAAIDYEFDLWGYVFMPDHVHLLLLPKAFGVSLSVAAKAVKQSVSRRAVAWLQEHHPRGLTRLLDRQPNGRVAHRFWQRGPGHDRNLFEPEAIHAELNYIHENPVRKQLVQNAEDWRWSSATAWKRRQSADIPLAFDSFPTLLAV